ncbi:uncharacterized protein H6S33_008071 [Morchella sextelata]|uniref:uncharacterized protein n=1 Tax=Morchella sextelata TaxID=1174677 RepID=UPI001D03A20A|nr:uncharacterized protein H6S33_008071 [Morchella sextelata]KAH0603067.1 hypothetical protein H6S33_008071 [Morchella sextelata]
MSDPLYSMFIRMVSSEDRFEALRPVPGPPCDTTTLHPAAKVTTPNPLPIEIFSDSDEPLEKKPRITSTAVPAGSVLDGSDKAATAPATKQQKPRVVSTALPMGQVLGGGDKSAVATATRKQMPFIVYTPVTAGIVPSGNGKSATATTRRIQMPPIVYTPGPGGMVPSGSNKSATATTTGIWKPHIAPTAPPAGLVPTGSSKLVTAAAAGIQSKTPTPRPTAGNTAAARRQGTLPASRNPHSTAFIEAPVKPQSVLGTFVIPPVIHMSGNKTPTSTTAAEEDSLPPLSEEDREWANQILALEDSARRNHLSDKFPDWDLGLPESIQPAYGSLYPGECSHTKQSEVSISTNIAGSTRVDIAPFGRHRTADSTTQTPPSPGKGPTVPTRAVIARHNMANATTKTSLQPPDPIATTTATRPMTDAATNTSSPSIRTTATIGIQTLIPRTSNAATNTAAFTTIDIEGHAFNVPVDPVEYFHVMRREILASFRALMEQKGTLRDFHMVWSSARKRAAEEIEAEDGGDLDVEEGRVVKRWRVENGLGKGVDKADGDEDCCSPKD